MIIKASRVLPKFTRLVFISYIFGNIVNPITNSSRCYTFCPLRVMYLKDFFNCLQQEYVQKTDPTSAPLSFKDEQKNEVQISISLLCFHLYYYLVSFSFAMCSISSCMIQCWFSVSGCVAILLYISLYTESCPLYL